MLKPSAAFCRSCPISDLSGVFHEEVVDQHISRKRHFCRLHFPLLPGGVSIYLPHYYLMDPVSVRVLHEFILYLSVKCGRQCQQVVTLIKAKPLLWSEVFEKLRLETDCRYSKSHN